MTREIDSYRVIHTRRIREFEEEMNNLLERGFQPWEEGQRDFDIEAGRFYQEMVRYADVADQIRETDRRTTTIMNDAVRAGEPVPVPPTVHWTAHTDDLFDDEVEVEEEMSPNQLNRLGVNRVEPVEQTVQEIPPLPNRALRQAVNEVREAQMEAAGEDVMAEQPL